MLSLVLTPIEALVGTHAVVVTGLSLITVGPAVLAFVPSVTTVAVTSSGALGSPSKVGHQAGGVRTAVRPCARTVLQPARACRALGRVSRCGLCPSGATGKPLPDQLYTTDREGSSPWKQLNAYQNAVVIIPQSMSSTPNFTTHGVAQPRA